MIDAINESIYKDAKFLIKKNFETSASQYGNKLCAVFLHADTLKEYNSNDSELVESILQKTRCQFCVNIIYFVDDEKMASSYEMDVRIILSPRISRRIDSYFERDTKRKSVRSNRIKFKKENKIDTIRITSDKISFITTYITGVVFMLFQNYADAYEIFNGLSTSNIIQNETYGEIIKKCHNFVCCNLASLYLSKFDETQDETCLDIAEEYLNEAYNISGESYGYHLCMASLIFSKYRNIEKSREHVEECKKINSSSAWRYSDAFLTAYTSIDVGKVYGKYIKAIKSEYNIVEIILFIENVCQIEPKKHMLHFALGILYQETNEHKLSIFHFKNFLQLHQRPINERCRKIINKELALFNEDFCEECDFKDCQQICKQKVE